MAASELHSPERVRHPAQHALTNMMSENCLVAVPAVCVQLGVQVVGAEVHGPDSAQHARLVTYLDRVMAFVDKVTLLSPRCFVESL